MAVARVRSPIVLIPGLFGFNRLQVGSWTVASYFAGIPEFLASSGNRVLIARPSPTAGVAQRAAELRAFLDGEAPAEAVHLIGHSMGGLDGRYLISKLGMSSRVLSLTTIATPHRGTAFADWGLRQLEWVVKPVLDLLDIPAQAFYDLTTAKCRVFNEEVPDVASVRYFSVAGRHEGDWWTPEWQLPHRIVAEAEGPNDGVVSVASATYGESTEIWEGDHISLANCSTPVAKATGRWRDYAPSYARLIGRLADEGF